MQLIKLYQPFFDANNWAHVLTSGQDWMMILTVNFNWSVCYQLIMRWF